MKKVIACILCLLMLLSFTSCGKKKSNAYTTNAISEFDIKDTSFEFIVDGYTKEDSASYTLPKFTITGTVTNKAEVFGANLSTTGLNVDLPQCFYSDKTQLSFDKYTIANAFSNFGITAKTLGFDENWAIYNYPEERSGGFLEESTTNMLTAFTDVLKNYDISQLSKEDVYNVLSSTFTTICANTSYLDIFNYIGAGETGASIKTNIITYINELLEFIKTADAASLTLTLATTEQTYANTIKITATTSKGIEKGITITCNTVHAEQEIGLSGEKIPVADIQQNMVSLFSSVQKSYLDGLKEKVETPITYEIGKIASITTTDTSLSYKYTDAYFTKSKVFVLSETGYTISIQFTTKNIAIHTAIQDYYNKILGYTIEKNDSPIFLDSTLTDEGFLSFIVPEEIAATYNAYPSISILQSFIEGGVIE